MVQVLALEMVVQHDVQKGLERRAGHLDAAVIEVQLGNSFVRRDNIIHAVDTNRQVPAARGAAFRR